MKTLTLLFTFLISFPLALSAQSAEDVLQKVSVAMTAEQWEQAVSLFRQAIQLNADKSEMFYWTSVDKASSVGTKMAQELTKLCGIMTKLTSSVKKCFKRILMT